VLIFEKQQSLHLLKKINILLSIPLSTRIFSILADRLEQLINIIIILRKRCIHLRVGI
jgi:hypothetical protein